MKNRTCCFSGHRMISKSQYRFIKEQLEFEIVKLIKKGIIYFGTGGALGFDTMAALKVLELRKIYPQIKLILVLPCVNQTRNWNEKDIAIYEFIKTQCDKYTYTSTHYSKGCMLKRNRHLVDNSTYCICYLTQNRGGTAYTVRYAEQVGVKVINIALKKPSE